MIQQFSCYGNSLKILQNTLFNVITKVWSPSGAMRKIITLIRAHGLLNCAHELVIRAHDLVIRAHDLVIRAHGLVIRAHGLA